MIFLYVLEAVLQIALIWFLCTQVLWPLWKERPLFPLWRERQRIIAEVREEVEAIENEALRERLAALRREADKRRRPKDPQR